MPAELAERLADRFAQEPFLVNFLPVVENQVLLELFASGVALPEGKTLRAAASFVERLNIFGAKVDSFYKSDGTAPLKAPWNWIDSYPKRASARQTT